MLGFLDAEAAGAVVPAFVRTEFKFGFDNALNTDGSFDYSGDGSPVSQSSPGPQKTGIGLQGLYFLSDAGARVGLVSTNLSSWWEGGPGIGQNPWHCGIGNFPNKRCAYSMFNNFKGLKLNGITTLPGVARPAGPGAQPAGDWYADYQDWLVANQTSPNTLTGGSWNTMGFSCCNHRSNFTHLTAAIAELILSPVALVLPDEEKFGEFGLSPATNTLIEGGVHTVTAHAESTGGTPVPGATVVFTILSGPNAGLTGTDTTDSNGEATFTYTDGGPLGTIGTDKIRASIGALNSNTVDMIWIPLNRPPVATDNSYGTNEDTQLGGNVVTDAPADSDPDAGDTLTATLVTGVANGTLSLNADGSFTYDPNANYCGPDSFTYQVNDGTVDSNVATVTIDVACVNDPPVANPDAKVTPEDTPVSGQLTASDIDGGALTFSGPATGPSNGGVVVNPDGSYTYSPNLNYNGPDSFTYTVSDGAGGTASTTVTITVLPVNDAPVAVNDAYTGQWNTLLTVPVNGVLGNDSDIDGGPLSSIKLTNPASGAIVLNLNGSLTYMPAANFAGVATFTYKANDGALDSNVATVSITITSPCPSKSRDGKSHDGNSSDDKSHHTGSSSDDRSSDDNSSDDKSGCAPGTPRSHGDHYTTKKNSPLAVALNKGVLKNDGALAVTAELIAGANHGTVVLAANGTFLYTPAANFVGNDAFYYVARSAAGVAGKAVKVSIRVRGHWDGDGCDHDKKKNKHKKGDKCDHDKEHD